MIAVSSGFLAGLAHTLAGPDHLAAVAPLALDRPRMAAWRVGALWGVGHGLGVIAVGVVVLGLMSGLGIEALAVPAELLVGILLIGLGLLTIKRASRQVSGAEQRHRHGRLALGIGMLHGVAGTSHLATIVPSLAMTRGEATVYFGAYVLAAVALMAGLSALLGRLAASAGTRLPFVLRVAGAMSILVGAVWLGLAFVG